MKQFVTLEQYIAYKDKEAAAKAKPVFFIKTIFEDSSESIDFYERVQKEVEYSVKKYNETMETWFYKVDTNLFINRWLPGECAISAKEIKQKYEDWLRKGSFNVKNIEYGYTLESELYHG